MDRTERHEFLEQLIAMRDGYRAVGAEQHGVLSIADAVLYAEAVMAAVASDVEPWLVELAGSYFDGTSDDSAAGTTRRTRPTRPEPEGWPWPPPWTRSGSSPEVDGD
jgi:hypothetical protein